MYRSLGASRHESTPLLAATVLTAVLAFTGVTLRLRADLRKGCWWSSAADISDWPLVPVCDGRTLRFRFPPR